MSSINGMDRLIDALVGLETGANRIIRKAIRSGQDDLEDQIEARIRSDLRADGQRKVDGTVIHPGGLEASIGSTMPRTSRGGTINAKTGLGVGREQVHGSVQVTKGGKQAVSYGHFGIIGTATRQTGSRSRKNQKTGKRTRSKTGKAVQNRGRVGPHPVIAAVAAASQATIETKIMNVAYDEVTLAWRRADG